MPYNTDSRMTLMVVTLSILVHGTSVKPMMERF